MRCTQTFQTECTLLQGQGQRSPGGRVTVSLSWEPPPVYDIAIQVAVPYEPRPNRPPSYDSHTREQEGGDATSESIGDLCGR